MTDKEILTRCLPYLASSSKHYRDLSSMSAYFAPVSRDLDTLVHAAEESLGVSADSLTAEFRKRIDLEAQ